MKRMLETADALCMLSSTPMPAAKRVKCEEQQEVRMGPLL
jgi:hypothetical protein